MKEYNFDFRIGSTTGYRNVQYETITAASEAAAFEKMKQKYNDSRDVITCTRSGEAETKEDIAKIEEELKTETNPQMINILKHQLEKLQE
ncbi:hypothetical protein [Pseudomonas sp. GZJR-8]|uniref:hypothetical protein n=1 Tax=Pseudomonas sp. GZJR-8 TaxID=1395925 RepID=UPI000CDA9DA3|nr:hypothetical protein [Pseudomonas sp. GZJR-8]